MFCTLKSSLYKRIGKADRYWVANTYPTYIPFLEYELTIGRRGTEGLVGLFRCKRGGIDSSVKCPKVGCKRH